MRLRLERYETANASAQTRSLLAFVFGGIGLVVFGFVMILGVLVMATPASEGGDVWSKWGGAVMSLFMGALPMGICALAISWGVRRRGRFRRLGELAAVARQTPGVTTSQVAHALRLSPADAERLVAEAMTLDLVESGPEEVEASAPTPAPSAPTVSAGHIAASAPASGKEIAAGTILGDAYRIEEPLGSGGMGTVFAARHLRTGRRYAVKTVNAGAKASEATIIRFEREATAASALGHPGIVQVHDFNAAPGGSFYLVMDLLEGETLASRLARGAPLEWSDAKRIALELCAALGAAHEHGLIHRDIKPSNIFLTKLARTSGSGERVVLVDFGLVKLMADSATQLTNTGAVIGTAMYMSPEQARGEELDVRSDLYSLAAVIFECVTGSRPFRDRTIASVYARLLNNEPPPRASEIATHRIPRALDDILLRALAKDRAARFPTARALGEALAAISEEAPGVPATRRMTS